MKIERLAIIAALGLGLLGLSALAQTDPGTGAGNDQGDKGAGKLMRHRWQLPVRPKLELPEKLKADIEAAQQAFRDYKAEQAELLKKLKSATAEERAALKEEMKANREEFREAQKAREQEIRARLKELRAQFVNDRQKALEAAKEEAKRGRGRR